MTVLADRPQPAVTAGPLYAEFFARRLRHVQGPRAGTPMVLEPWQREDLDLIMEVDQERGRRAWQKVLYGLPRGNNKTPLAGGLGLAELVMWRDGPRVFAAAGKKGQAALLHEFTRPQVEDGRPLAAFLRPQRHTILAPRWNGALRTLAADGDLEHGHSVSFAVKDEYHVWKSGKQRELDAALSTALKRPHSWEIAITTAGKSKHSLLGMRYDAAVTRATETWVSPDGCVTIAANREARTLMIWRGLPDGGDAGDEVLWRAVNAASWVDLDYLRTQAMTLPQSVFRRLHLNQWVEGESAAIPGGLWDACEGVVVLPDGVDVWVGVAQSDQTESGCVCVLGPPDGDGVRHVVFTVVDGDDVSASLAAAVAAAAMRWRVQAVAYNSVLFAREADDLALQGVRLHREARAGEPGLREVDAVMIPASRRVLEEVAAQRIRHAGDPQVREQVTAAEARMRDGGWRLARPAIRHVADMDVDGDAPRGDAALALAFALYSAESAPPPQWRPL